jgi:hypothetical protein
MLNEPEVDPSKPGMDLLWGNIVGCEEGSAEKTTKWRIW